MGVMGRNLALNLEMNGNIVSIHNRKSKGEENLVTGFMKNEGKGKNFIAASGLEDFVNTIKAPRVILIMIKAGDPVDDVISGLLPLLDDGDTLIDGGNSNFEDTERRAAALRFKKINYAGIGISGGAEGARKGPSIMAGTTKKCWNKISRLLEPLAAESFNGTPCCALVGSGGAGHFVKMVHNGIEYADMQIISESYMIMKDLLGMTAYEISDLFQSWNSTSMGSYLLEITSDILKVTEDDGVPLVDRIVDSAGQKGTGRWTVQTALELGISVPVISEAVFARSVSSLSALRKKLSSSIEGPDPSALPANENRNMMLEVLAQAHLASRMVAAAEGFYLISEAAKQFNWKTDAATVARIWQGGCIIRSELLRNIVAAYEQGTNLTHLFQSPIYANRFRNLQDGWRKCIAVAIKNGIPVPAMTASLAEYDSLRSDHLPANIIQAQRDYFGSHMYERTDKNAGELFHTDWKEKLNLETEKSGEHFFSDEDDDSIV